MRLVVDRLQTLRADVRVNLRRAQVGVPEQLLHAAQIGSRVKKMRGERMAQFVRGHIRRQTGGGQIKFEVALEAPRRQASAVLIDEERRLPPGVRRPERTDAEIFAQSPLRGPPESAETFFFAFSAHLIAKIP